VSPSRRTLLVLSGVVFLVMTGISIVIPVLPLYGETFGVSNFLIGLLVAALPAARVVTDLPGGTLGDRFGNRRMMMVGLIIVAVSSFLAVIPGQMEPNLLSFTMLISIRVAEGVGSAFYVTSSLAALAKSAPMEKRGSQMSFYVMALLIGATIGPVIGGGAAAVGGLVAPFVVYGALATGGFLVIWRFYPRPVERLEPDKHIDWSAARSLLTNRHFVTVNFGALSAFFIRAGLMNTVLPLYIAQVLLIDPLRCIQRGSSPTAAGGRSRSCPAWS
jgi:MFS family permease